MSYFCKGMSEGAIYVKKINRDQALPRGLHALRGIMAENSASNSASVPSKQFVDHSLLSSRLGTATEDSSSSPDGF